MDTWDPSCDPKFAPNINIVNVLSKEPDQLPNNDPDNITYKDPSRNISKSPRIIIAINPTKEPRNYPVF